MAASQAPTSAACRANRRRTLSTETDMCCYRAAPTTTTSTGTNGTRVMVGTMSGSDRARGMALTLGDDPPAPCESRTALTRLSEAEHDARSQRERGGLEKQPIQLRERPMVRGAFPETSAQGIMRACRYRKTGPAPVQLEKRSLDDADG